MYCLSLKIVPKLWFNCKKWSAKLLICSELLSHYWLKLFEMKWNRELNIIMTHTTLSDIALWSFAGTFWALPYFPEKSFQYSLAELRIIKLEDIRFDPKTDSGEFSSKNAKLGTESLPWPALEVIPPAYRHRRQTWSDRTSGSSQRGSIKTCSTREESSNKTIFQKMHAKLASSKTAWRTGTATVDDICLLARTQLTISNLCKIDDFAENAFNEVSASVSDNLGNVLSKIYKSQENMESRIN